MAAKPQELQELLRRDVERSVNPPGTEEKPLTWNSEPLLSSLLPLSESCWECPPERGQLERGCRAADGRRSSRPRSPGAASPVRGVPGTGQPAAKRGGRGGDLAPSLGLLARSAVRAQGRECAGRQPQPLTPSAGGKGERRFAPFQGSCCIPGRCLCLTASVQAELRRLSCPVGVQG